MKKKIALLLVFAMAFSLIYSDSSTLAARKKPKINVKKLNTTVGADFQLRIYNMKKKYTVTYMSTNTDIVTVTPDENSKKRATLTAMSIGSAKIIATVKKNDRIIRTLKCKVKVTPSAVGIKLMKRKVKVSIGKKKRLDTIIKPGNSMERPVFESDDPNIASVNSNGVITGISPGTVTIRATLLSSDMTATCTITVQPEEPKDIDDEDY